MCLSLLPTAGSDARAPSPTSAHDGISCADTVAYIAVLPNGRQVVVQSIAVQGAPCVGFPVPPDHSQRLVPCSALGCGLAEGCKRVMEPSNYVTYDHDEDEPAPVYRSLAGGGAEAVALPDLEVIANSDGTRIAIIPLARHMVRDLTVERRAQLGEPVLQCVEDGLRKADVDPRRVFGPEYDAAAPHTKFGLLGLLLEQMTPGCDIVIGIMAEGATHGRFTFCFDYDAPFGYLPLLGLTHGDRQAMQTVDEAFYVVSNHPSVRLTLSKDVAYAGENVRRLGHDVAVPLAHAEAFIDRASHDYYSWGASQIFANKQRVLQRQAVRAIHQEVNALLGQLPGIGKDGLASAQDKIQIANLKGLAIPRNTVEACVSV